VVELRGICVQILMDMLLGAGELIWHSILDITVAWLMCTYAAGYKHSTAIAFTWFLVSADFFKANLEFSVEFFYQK
jgi:hypothetical protein